MEKKKVLNNATWIIVCQCAKALLALLISMLSARYLGSSNYGIINYASSIASFVAPIMYLGVDSTLVHELLCNPQNEGEVLGSAIGMSFCSSLFCIFGIFAFVSVVNVGEHVIIIACILHSLLLIAQSFDLIQYWFQAKLLSKYNSLAMLGAYVLVSIYKIYLLCSQKNVYWFAISQTFDYCLIAIALFVIYKKMGGVRLKFSFSRARDLFSRSKYYIVSSMMVAVFAQTDRIMLKLMLDEAAVGYYSAAVTCAGVTSFVFQAIIVSARPVILSLKKVDEAEYEQNISRLYSVIIYLSLLQSICMVLCSKLIVFLLYGSQYMESVSALRIVVWYSTFSYLGSVRNIWILSEQKQRYLWKINLFGAMANVVLNYVLIPKYGINGAAAASLVTQIFTNVFVGYFIKAIRRNNYLMRKGLNIKWLFSMLQRGFRKGGKI